MEAFPSMEQGRRNSQHLQKDAETDDDNHSHAQPPRLTCSTTLTRESHMMPFHLVIVPRALNKPRVGPLWSTRCQAGIAQPRPDLSRRLQ